MALRRTASGVVKNSRIKIFPVGQTEPEVRKALPEWFHREFGSTGFTWATPDYYALSDVDGELIGRLGIFDRQVAVQGTRIRVGGIGGVITKPELRLRGVASDLLRQAVIFMRNELGVEFGLLLCRREVAPVYAKLGWTRIQGPTLFMQPSGMTTYPRDTMVLRLTETQWPPGTINMCGLPW